MNKILFSTGISIFALEALIGVSYFFANANSGTLKVAGFIAANIIAFAFVVAGSLSEE